MEQSCWSGTARRRLCERVYIPLKEKTMNLKLELTVNEINTIMQALGQMPYASVYELVAKIKTQAEAQLAPQENPDA
jgi:hypothetical protein